MESKLKKLNNKNTILQILKAFPKRGNSVGTELDTIDSNHKNMAFPADSIQKFKQVLQALKLNPDLHSSPKTDVKETHKSPAQSNDEQSLQLRQNLEKMSALVKKKDQRINELLQYEYSAKKAIKQKTWQQEALEKEKLHVKLLEKENEKQAAELIESRQNTLKLEQTVDIFQKQNEELHFEKNQLNAIVQKQNETISNLTLENENANLRCQQLDQDLALESAAKQEQDAEIKALYKQFQTLRGAFESQKHGLEKKIESVKNLEELLAQSQNEKNELKQTLRACQEEVFTIKQLVTKGMRDAKDLENRYCEAVSEKISTLKTFHQQQREFDKQHKELIETKDKLKNNAKRENEERLRTNEELLNLKRRNSQLEEKLMHLNYAKNALEDKLDLLAMKNEVVESERDHLQKTNENLANGSSILSEQLSQQLELLRESMHNHAALQSRYEQMQEEFNTQQVHLEEKQIQLDEAHQHLAKKVREAALLSEKVEELALQISDIDNVREALQEASTQLQNDLRREEGEKIELNEKVQLLEEEIKKFEERWLYAEHRNQQTAEKIAELEKIEKRHAQLQSLLSGFGPLPGVNYAENKNSLEVNPVEKHPPLQFGCPLPVIENEEIVKTHEETSKAYPNLFDLPQAQVRSKQNLFD